jgi:carbamoyltransferase
LAGGVALNCVANGRLLREGPYERLWIQPAAGDAGGSLGSALYVWHQLLNNPRYHTKKDKQQGSFLGPQFSSDEIEEFLDGTWTTYERIDDQTELCNQIAEHLANDKIVGWFQGRMEFGPRALGGRSILGDPRSHRMQATMNLKIKFRESFRPFAPAVLQDAAHEWLELDQDQESPYMLLVANIRRSQRVPISNGQQKTMDDDPDLRRRVNVVRSTIPAVTHVDYSARVQTVDEERNPRFCRLLKSFYDLTGCPVLVNTSFNVRGEPIVCTPAEAYRCFQATDMDVLVLGEYVVVKPGGRQETGEVARSEYLAQFQLD